jgi:adenylate kinase
MRLVFLGGPGSGKGTQAKKLVEKFGLAHISTGDLLRQAIKEETELGKTAKKFVDGGDLVPDEIILGMIKEKLTELNGGFIFDGFPRTLAQAEGLSKLLNEMNLEIDKVVNLNVDDSIIIDRLSARRMCRTCGFEYNLKTRTPKVDGVCDIDGGELYQRSDDNEETIKNRLELYHNKTKPIEDFYRSNGNLVDIDGAKGFDEVFASVVKSIGAE